jgi:hypothetical protein
MPPGGGDKNRRQCVKTEFITLRNLTSTNNNRKTTYKESEGQKATRKLDRRKGIRKHKEKTERDREREREREREYSR